MTIVKQQHMRISIPNNLPADAFVRPQDTHTIEGHAFFKHLGIESMVFPSRFGEGGLDSRNIYRYMIFTYYMLFYLHTFMPGMSIKPLVQVFYDFHLFLEQKNIELNEM